MIISNHQIQIVLRQYGIQKAMGIENKQPVESTNAENKDVDRAEFSQDAALLQKARDAAKQVPDVRRERIREIKNALARGEYAVSAQDVAEKMLGRLIVDDLI